jgi:hypothetical protein
LISIKRISNLNSRNDITSGAGSLAIPNLGNKGLTMGVTNLIYQNEKGIKNDKS